MDLSNSSEGNPEELLMDCDDEATDYLLGRREELMENYQKTVHFFNELDSLLSENDEDEEDDDLLFKKEQESVLLEFINDCENMLLRKRQKSTRLKVKRIILPSDLPYLNEPDYKKVVHLMASGNAILDMDTRPRDYLSACHLLQDSLPEIDFKLPPKQKASGFLLELEDSLSPFQNMTNEQRSNKGKEHYELYQSYMKQKEYLHGLSALMASAYYQDPPGKAVLQQTLRKLRLKTLLSDEDKPVKPLSKKALLLQAHCQLTGIGRLQNDKFASQSYRYLAKEREMCGAQLALAMCYFDGIGVKQSEKLGYSWIKKAAAGSDTAKIELALCYLYGRGVVANEKKMLAILEPLADRKLPFACFLVGLCYSYGLGTEQDMEKGIAYSDMAPDINIQDLGDTLRRHLMTILDGIE